MLIYSVICDSPSLSKAAIIVILVIAFVIFIIIIMTLFSDNSPSLCWALLLSSLGARVPSIFLWTNKKRNPSRWMFDHQCVTVQYSCSYNFVLETTELWRTTVTPAGGGSKSDDKNQTHDSHRIGRCLWSDAACCSCLSDVRRCHHHIELPCKHTHTQFFLCTVYVWFVFVFFLSNHKVIFEL